MNVIGSVLSTIKPREDDLGSDRMNYYYTTVMIMFVSITITMKQQVGNPLQCWVPQQFKKPWEQYAENYCFVYNTYWVNPTELVPDSVQERIAKQLIYYQWVSFIMGLEAFFFYLPAAIWGAMYRKSGLNILSMTKAAIEAEKATDEAVRLKKLGIIKMHFAEYVRVNANRKKYNPTLFKRMGKFGLVDGCFISNSYIFIKCLYMLNIIGQFLMQNQFLGQYNHLWGATILSDIISGSNWEDTGNFPRIAMWFIVVFAYTFTDTLQLAIRTRVSGKKEEFIRKYLKVAVVDEALLTEFCKKKINADIVIIMAIISNHSSDIITTELIELMWKEHRDTIFPPVKQDSDPNGGEKIGFGQEQRRRRWRPHWQAE
ncbi:unnamed protein product, partial [Mesorhabditis spiculigera]